MSTEPPREPTQEELRAAYEAELKRVRVQDVLIQSLVSLVNLGGRRAGLADNTQDEVDAEQLRLAIEGARALLPLVEPELGPDVQQVRQAISQLQMAYAQRAGQPGGEGAPQGADEQPKPEEGATGPEQGGPAQSSGRLWVPGQ